ncbi:alanine racemase [Paenibacillus macquariensis]|uniref:Alanine racemase n=1 Tax=Paenibacillus macquariensis TaxID=948756 RepID=A0ABY1JRD6_9BACL|nr:alanine racemase [Paenibacillus macquariensis]MEC0092735.1 alanine racemase [Paenibacillus macquariensis]OAB36128.1 alanine racemase [Paenibacillus macquariensis subsp. macquariensis]SIQ65038.1 alanine racemase [Paenibacillus macquariensis]
MLVNYRPTIAEINLDHLIANYHVFRSALPQDMMILACVKANAYGHGAVKVAQEMEKVGANYLSVAFLDEALELRRAGIQLPILILGYTPPEAIQVAWENDITVTLFTQEVLDAMSQLPVQSTDKPLKVHIKIDSGMGRLGLFPGDEAQSFIEKAFSIPGIEVEGLYTHYAKADEEDKSYTLEQYRRFLCVADALEEKGYHIPIIHTGNSATAIDMPLISHNMVRIGISLYGLYPSDEVNAQKIALTPVLTLKTQTVYVKTLPPHAGISYGSKYVTEDNEVIATLPIGYADGYSRMLSGKAEVLIRGRRIPVVGTICMDQCMVSLQTFAEEAKEIQVGEEVVLIGQQSGDCITADELASKLGTIHYEVICMLAARIPRHYIQGGILQHVVNPLML